MRGWVGGVLFVDAMLLFRDVWCCCYELRKCANVASSVVVVRLSVHVHFNMGLSPRDS